jgi:hypothetical protein
MQKNYRRIGLIVGLVLVCTARLGAQSVVGYGAAEAGGRGSSLFLLGLSASGAGTGWQPVASIQAYRLSFLTRVGTSTSTTTTTNNVFSPAVGLKYNTGVGATQFQVGYAFVNSSTENPVAVGTFPIPAASKNGVFVTAQGDYWGTGEHTAQFIASWNFGNEFLWSRVRAAQRIGGTDSPVMLGAEAGLLGGGTGAKDTWGFFVGPTLGFRVTPDFRLTLAGGYRANTSTPNNASGYAKVDFVYLFPH